MSDQQLIANDGLGNSLNLGAVYEADRTSSMQVADRVLRQELEMISEALRASHQSLVAAAEAINRAVLAFNGG